MYLFKEKETSFLKRRRSTWPFEFSSDRRLIERNEFRARSEFTEVNFDLVSINDRKAVNDRSFGHLEGVTW